MKLIKFLPIGLLMIFLTAGFVLAQELVIYPAKGQSAEQMDKDKYECYNWAKQQSGFDPMAQPKATAAPPAQEAQKGGVVRGGLRGAAVGAVVGEIANDDAGQGAKAGAAAGAIAGGLRKRDQAKQQQKAEEQWAQEQAAGYAKNRDGYNRAYSACLEGKGYTVK
jgi:flagellar biosynthesis/type III secretory pathway protein FliH